ncbi:FAD-dependent monooxygenase [Nocardioides bruguierae]|uniref:FAD-dependent monooxygenase n=1 Tax=Nocardioides bruguierae TaxID=2945102 RepID=A0A9X2D915_9ACTN|nr:FAD-dependent monooxygenase [Nocardioides bruguierae]MCM0621380.1 FAD-dependent monooxygenase [Nocardioides bruguierae]
MSTHSSTSVLVVGAGPAGLTLACDLRRRGVDVRIISAATGVFPGSRAKGVQPRTLEVLDDLAVLEDVAAHATTYPKLGIHLGPAVIKRRMISLHRATEDVPYPNTLLSGQYDTDAALLRRLEQLGGSVEFETRLTGLAQTDGTVTATLEGPDGVEQCSADYLVGADGGSSAVRRSAAIPFEGTTDETDRMIVADLVMSGLSRDLWHIWPGLNGHFMALCPMPGGELFQLMLKLKPGEPAEMTSDALTRAIRARRGTRSVQIAEVRWSSVWRPNVRLAQRYRSERVFLIGDAAHVHPPTGAQGLNTGVQDAYNLGWKLAQVIAGAPDGLLDSYEAERQPVAAGVLGLAVRLYDDTRAHPSAALKRGDEERQLSLTYRGGPLALDVSDDSPGVRPGDRASNVSWVDPSEGPQRLIDHLRGPHFTLLALGEAAVEAVGGVAWPAAGARLHTISLTGASAQHVATAYGVTLPTQVLIRPDGYVAQVAHENFADAVNRFISLSAPR